MCVCVWVCATTYLVKHLDERVADDFALLLRVCHPGELSEEEVRGVDEVEVHTEAVVCKCVYVCVLACVVCQSVSGGL